MPIVLFFLFFYRLVCLMQQMLSFAATRDEVDDRFIELSDAKFELRQHRIGKKHALKKYDQFALNTS